MSKRTCDCQMDTSTVFINTSRLIGVVCGSFIIAVGVYGYVWFEKANDMFNRLQTDEFNHALNYDAAENFYYKSQVTMALAIYIVFGLTAIIAETRIPFLLKWAVFLNTSIGRTVFYFVTAGVVSIGGVGIVDMNEIISLVQLEEFRGDTENYSYDKEEKKQEDIKDQKRILITLIDTAAICFIGLAALSLLIGLLLPKSRQYDSKVRERVNEANKSNQNPAIGASNAI